MLLLLHSSYKVCLPVGCVYPWVVSMCGTEEGVSLLTY